MRIVGGKFGGRALVPVGKGDAAAHLRPTTDRVRESLFNTLEHRDDFTFEDARVLDLFAGTGALGLEAISRGASFAVFIDNGVAGRGLIRRNIEAFGLTGATKLLRRDATRLGPSKGTPFDIVFVDPPYGMGLAPKALASALAGGWLAPDALVVVEEAAAVALPEGFTQLEERRYGDTVMTFGRPEA